jgi:glycosyltransferase involved in cell wall biosynthesis
MKVLIALASSSGQLSGVQRHAINLARCLLTRGEISAVHMVFSPWQQKLVQDAMLCEDTRLHLHSAPISSGVLSRNLWFYLRLPKLATELEADIVHLAYPVPVRGGAFHCPTVTTLHDLYPYDIPENFGFPKVLFNRAILRQCLETVDKIACVSQSTLSRLESFNKHLAQKATVIYNSVEQQAQCILDMSPPEWGSYPFLLCVAQHRRNKNVPLVLQVFERMLRTRRLPDGMRLLIVGIPGPETSAIKKLIAASGLAHSVVLLSGISDAQLQWCYRNCGLVLAPSVVEGFGLPVAEALLAGCHVVCSDIPAFRELGGNQCHYVPLGPDEAMAFADGVCNALRQASPKPVAMPQLAAPVIAAQYFKLYRSLSTVPVAQKGSSHAMYPSSKERQNLI